LIGFSLGKIPAADEQMKFCSIFVSAIFLALTANCVVIPKKAGTRGPIDRNTIQSLEKGVITRRDQVLLQLGQPEEVGEQERLFVYKWVDASDVGVPGGSFESWNYFTLLIEFDEQGILHRIKRCKSNSIPPFCQFDGTISSSNLYTDGKYEFSIQFPSNWQVSNYDQFLIPSTMYRISTTSDNIFYDLMPIMPISKHYVVNATHREMSGFPSRERGWWRVAIAIHPITEEVDRNELYEQRSSGIISQAAKEVFFDLATSLKKIDYFRDTSLPNSENINFKLLEAKEATISGISACRKLYQLQHDLQDTKDTTFILMYLLVSNSRLYQLTGSFTGRTKTFEEKSKILDETLRSFYLTDLNNQ
jgi:hypothetical protein